MSKSIKNIFVQGAISPAFIAQSIEEHSRKTAIGAHALFLGQVRSDKIDSKTVSAIQYTAHQEMALEKFHEIRHEIFSAYDLQCMHVHHSLGTIKSGDICLFVFTSSKHRKAAQEACNDLVERIKAQLPVWGKEIFEDTTHQWKINK